MGPVSQYVVKAVARELDRHGIVVWYDKDGHFSKLVEGLADEKTVLAVFTGSYYRLRAAAEELFDQYDSAAMTGLQRLLVYVPAGPLDKRSDVLLEISRSGTVYNDSLPTVARMALKEKLPAAILDEILANDNLTLAELDRLAEGEATAGASTLAVIFGTVAAHEIAAHYLTEPAWEEKIDQKGALTELIQFFSKSFGIPGAGMETHSHLKNNLPRHLLLTEFIHDNKFDRSKTTLANFSFPRQTANVEACCRAARFMREWAGSKDTYIALAKKVEEECRLRELHLPYNALGRVDTFPFEEKSIHLSLENLVREGREDIALRLIEERRGSFWMVVEPLRAVQWQATEIALKLYQETKRISAEIKKFKQSSPDTWVRLYSSDARGEGRWHQIDMQYRRMERLIGSMDEEFALVEMLKTVRRAYYNTVQEISELFSAALSENGLNFNGHLLQSDIYRKIVRPLVAQGPTAYIMADSLRFEMGVELTGMLGSVQVLQFNPALATPPTITKIGMAALLPGAEEGLAVVPAKEGIAAEVNGEVLADSRDRQKYLSGMMADRVTDLTLGAVLDKGKRALANQMANRDLIIVRSQEIDSMGEDGNIYQARRVMTEVLADIRKAVQRLAEAGVQNFVITADHGHLFGEELGDEMKPDPPGGETLELHRRCWVGRGGAGSDAFLRFKAAELGLGGDLEFAFPRGAGGFKVKGGKQAYFHGGLSLQEMVIPVMTFKMEVVKPAKTSDFFSLKLNKKEVTNRLFTVSATYVPAMYSPGELNVRFAAVEGGKEIAMAATAVYGYDEETGIVRLKANEENHVTMMVTGAEARGKMAVQLLDANTGLVLDECIVTYSFAV